MNYAIAFLALILLFAAIYWYAGGRRFYTGPIVEAMDSDSQTRVDMNHEVGSGADEKVSTEYPNKTAIIN